MGVVLGPFKAVAVGILEDGTPRMSYLVANWCMKSRPYPMLLSGKSLRRNCHHRCFLITALLASWVPWPHKELARDLQSVKIACVYKSPFLRSVRTTPQISLTLKPFWNIAEGSKMIVNYKFFLGGNAISFPTLRFLLSSPCIFPVVTAAIFSYLSY